MAIIPTEPLAAGNPKPQIAFPAAPLAAVAFPGEVLGGSERGSSPGMMHGIDTDPVVLYEDPQPVASDLMADRDVGTDARGCEPDCI